MVTRIYIDIHPRVEFLGDWRFAESELVTWYRVRIVPTPKLFQ